LLALKENKIGMAQLLIHNGANIHAADDLNRYSAFDVSEKYPSAVP
jgi:hypothetical protein